MIKHLYSKSGTTRLRVVPLYLIADLDETPEASADLENPLTPLLVTVQSSVSELRGHAPRKAQNGLAISA